MSILEENQREQYNEYDEISLKELIMSVWNERVLVVAIMIVTVLLAGVYTFAFLKPQYETTSELMMKELEDAHTLYGTYSFPSDNISDYTQFIYNNEVIDQIIDKYQLDVSRETFKKNITVNQEKDSNRISVVVVNGDPELAYKINSDLIERFIESIRISYKKSAMDEFILSHQHSIESYQNSIRHKEGILAETRILLDEIQPIYTLQKLLFSDPKAAAAYADQLDLDLSAISENLMTEEYINENYFNMEAKIYDLEYELVSIREGLENQNQLLAELLGEQESYNQLIDTENESEILNGHVDVMASNIRIISYPNHPINPSSPRVALNMAIGVVLGMMLGVFSGLFKSYWKNA